MSLHPLILIALLFNLCAFAAEEKPKEKTYEGTLQTGIMAIGGETTGVILKTREGTAYELDLRKGAGLEERAAKLDKKEVSVTGKLEIRKGVEIKERQILVVTDLKVGEKEGLPPTKEIDVRDLCQHWVHSQEDQQAGDKEQLFRPESFKKFPPSRFRMAYKFESNGDCEWLYLSPTDKHEFKAGKWKIDPKDNAVIHITKDGTTEAYRVMELKKDILRLLLVGTKTDK